MHDAFRRALEDCDVALVRKIWAHVMPNMPQPKTDAEALVTLHHARTQIPNIAFKLRAYSHRWLVDHGYPSGLPDALKPKAERIYPKIVEAVGIAVNSLSGMNAGAAKIIQRAMADEVEECFAAGKKDPAYVKQRMLAVRDETKKKLMIA